MKILGRSRTKWNTGPKAEYEHGFSHFFPHLGLFCQKQIHLCINEIAKMCFLLFCPVFQINKKSITKQQFKNIYLTLNFFNILSDIIPTKHNLT